MSISRKDIYTGEDTKRSPDGSKRYFLATVLTSVLTSLHSFVHCTGFA